MNKRIIQFFIVLLFTVNIFAQETENKQNIIWLQNQRPPWMINSGKSRNKGYGDKIRQHFEKVLNNYKHKIVPVNPSRFVKEMNKYDNLCYGPVTKVDFIVDKFYWSKALYAVPKQKIIVLESTFKQLGSPKKISMEKLLSNQNYIFGKLANLNHYPMKKFKKQKNIQEISTSDSTTNLLSMLQKKRIDWIYDFPLYITWHVLQPENIINEKYKTIEVLETKRRNKIVGYMACSKNEFGKKIISQINKNITKETIYKIRNIVRQWQPDQLNTDTFDKINKELYDF